MMLMSSSLDTRTAYTAQQLETWKEEAVYMPIETLIL